MASDLLIKNDWILDGASARAVFAQFAVDDQAAPSAK